MQFCDSIFKLILVLTTLLGNYILVIQCASLAVVPNVTMSTSSNASNPESSHVPVDLLDETKLTFLIECKNATVDAKEICDLYHSLVKVLSQRKRDPVTAAKLLTAIDEQVDGERFCSDLSPLLRAVRKMHPNGFESERLQNHRFCENSCVPQDRDTLSTHVKPICKVLLWGFRTELLPEEEDPVKQAVNVMVPPLIPIGGVPFVEKEHATGTNPAQPTAAAQRNVTSPEKFVKIPPPQNANADQAKDAAPNARPSEGIAVGAPTNTVGSPADDSLLEEDNQDPNEVQNQKNLKDIDENSLANTFQDDDDDPEAGTEFSENDQQNAPENVKPKLDQMLDMGKTDSNGKVDDQQADAAAVQVERVEQEDPFFDQDDSNFFSYFLFMMFVCILCYVAYHNKSKLLALVVEGRRSNSGRGGFSKGRKHTAAYRKLDSNLEEAITSNAAASSRSTSQIIY